MSKVRAAEAKLAGSRFSLFADAEQGRNSAGRTIRRTMWSVIVAP